jgi:hypothetical protein
MAGGVHVGGAEPVLRGEGANRKGLFRGEIRVGLSVRG